MPSSLTSYLSARPEAATFLLPADLERTLEELFPRPEWLLPNPYKIFPADETQPPIVGFPLAESPVMRELETKLDRWLNEEVAWQAARNSSAKEKAQLAYNLYITQLMKVAENALMSNLLNDYHAVFWLAHSADLAKHFSSIPRRVSVVDTQVGRTQGDALKYRIFAKWASDTRELVTQMANKAATILDGEEQRGLQFLRLLQDDVLILTEEFIGPDLRELRSFLHGYMRRDSQSFRDGFEKLRAVATDLLQKDRTFKAALPFFGVNADQGVPVALLLNSRFQNFLFDHPSVQNTLNREDREQFQLIARRVREFAVLNQLRRGVTWMTSTPDERLVSTDKRNTMIYSRSTRPMDFGRQGVVDPMVHRFGLMYDISNFSETLGAIARGGRKGEQTSYRQMLLFQRKLEVIAQRHLLQFEKFLGDGAFYTTRRGLRLVRAAVEIQRFYSEMKDKGFAFNKGLRIAINYGYYRLLPMKGGPDGTDRITEFYGPGIVELSRLTTGKASKEIEEIAGFLIARGYDSGKVQNFFAPLQRGVDVIDHTQHAREFYAYVNANGHLINEGIVASMALLQELSGELTHEAQQLHRLRTPWGMYIGFAPAVPGVEYVGLRLIGMVSLKGLDNIETGEIVPFEQGEVEATPIDAGESLITLLRQDYHQREGAPQTLDQATTHEREVGSEIVICLRSGDGSNDADEVLIGEWNPLSDEVRHALRIPRADFQRLFALRGTLSTEILTSRKESVTDLYYKLSDRADIPSMQLASFREGGNYDAFVLGEVVEKL